MSSLISTTDLQYLCCKAINEVHLVLLGVLRDNESLSSVPMDIDSYMKNSEEKTPDRLVDSCKCSSVYRMAAGSRLRRSNHGTFSPFY